jgi:hypothetical protein
MKAETERDRNVALAKEYFSRGDARRADLLNLFHPQFQLYFAKFGIKRGPRVHVYLDPDYTSEDAPRFHWGREGRTW